MTRFLMQRAAKVFSWIAAAIERISSAGGIIAYVGIGVLMALLIVDVVVKQALGRGSVYTFELVGYLVVLIAFAGAAETLRRGRHIRIDLIVRYLPAKVHSITLIITSVLGVLFLGIFIQYALRLVIHSYTLGRTMHSVLSPPVFPLYSLMVLGAFLLALQLLVRLFRTVAHSVKETGERPQ